MLYPEFKATHSDLVEKDESDAIEWIERVASKKDSQDLDSGRDEYRDATRKLVEKFIEDQNMSLLLSDKNFAHAVYLGVYNNSDAVIRKLADFLQTIPYLSKDTWLPETDTKSRVTANMLEVIVPESFNEEKLNELSEKAEKILRVQSDLLFRTGKKPYIAVSPNNDVPPIKKSENKIIYFKAAPSPFYVEKNKVSYSNLSEALTKAFSLC